MYHSYSYDNAQVSVEVIDPMIERLSENSLLHLITRMAKEISWGRLDIGMMPFHNTQIGSLVSQLSVSILVQNGRTISRKTFKA
jgi:hypothetical protein